MNGDEHDDEISPGRGVSGRLRSPWGSPFFAPRNQLLGGILLGLAVGGGFFGLRTLFSDQPPHPDEWLTLEAQEQLSDVVLTPPVERWAAGCLWMGRDPRDITEIVDWPDDGTLFRVFEWQNPPEGLRLSVLTFDDVAPGDGSFGEVRGRGYFCYVPISP